VTQYNSFDQDSAGGNLSGEFLQMGQEAFNRSHSSMQSEWKQCLHSGMVLSVSLGLYSHKHIEQVLSSGLGNLLLSPRTILGYDSIVGPSNPAIITTDSVSTVESTSGRPPDSLLLLSQYLTLPQMKHRRPTRINAPGIPAAVMMA
jgi:hypothetical protein